MKKTAAKSLGVVAGLIGATATVASTVYTVENPGLVADYVKGEETYTSQQMQDTKLSYENKITQIESENAIKEEKIVELTTSVAANDTRIQELETENAQKDEQIALLQQNVQDQVDMRDMLEAENTEKQKTIDQLTADNNTKANEITQLNQTIEANNTKIAELEAEIETNLEDMDSLIEELAMYEESNAQLTEEVNSLNATVEENNTTISELEAEVTANEQEINRLNTLISQKNTQISELQADIETANTTISDLQADNDAKLAEITSLRSQLSAIINGVEVTGDISDELLGNTSTYSLSTGNYLILSRNAPYNLYYFNKDASTIQLIEQPSEGYCNNRPQNLNIGNIFIWFDYNGMYPGAWTFNEETKQVEIVSEKYIGGLSYVSLGNNNYILGKANGTISPIIWYNGVMYPTDNIEGDCGAYSDTTITIEDEDYICVANSHISLLINLNDGSIRKIADAKVYTRLGNYFYYSVNSVNYIYNLETDTTEEFTLFTPTVYIDNYLMANVTETDEEGNNTYYLQTYKLDDKTTQKIQIPNTFYVSSNRVCFNHLFMSVTASDTDETIGGTYALSLETLELTKVMDDTGLYEAMYTKKYESENFAVFHTSSYGSYILKKDLSDAQISSSRYASFVGSLRDNYVIVDRTDTNRCIVFDVSEMATKTVFSAAGYSYYAPILCSEDEVVIIAAKLGDDGYISSVEVITFNSNNEINVIGNLEYFSEINRLIITNQSSYETERYIVKSTDYVYKSSYKYCAVVYDKVKNEFNYFANIRVSSCVEQDGLLALSCYNIGQSLYLYNPTNGETISYTSTTSGSASLSKVGEMVIVRFGSDATVYVPEQEQLTYVEVLSNVNDLKIFKENDEKVILYNSSQVLTIDKTTNTIIDSFLVDSYEESTATFKLDIVESEDCYLGCLYTFQEDTFTFTKSMVS